MRASDGTIGGESGRSDPEGTMGPWQEPSLSRDTQTPNSRTPTSLLIKSGERENLQLRISRRLSGIIKTRITVFF